jgi:creatinine amidohydrolase
MPHPRDPQLLSDLAADDIAAYLENRRTVLIPIASTEQHGPHLPLSTDTITAEEVSKRAAHETGVLYTPTVWTGYSPQHLRDPQGGTGTIAVRASTFAALIDDIAHSLIHHGFTHLIMVNGHGSNMKIIDPILRKIRYGTGAFVACYKPYAERYMGLVDDILENPREEMPGWHSSELETSQVLAYDETLVVKERIAETKVTAPEWLPDAFQKADGAPDIEFDGYQYFVMPMDHQEFTPTGVIGNPERATAEKGEEAFKRFGAHLAKAIPEFEKVPVEILEDAKNWTDRA